ncbi:thiamine pyrophosphate-binding protein [Nitrogeniibacter mangrovi]|uniref:Thiamine pyrophosphate-binding protein n=1 Tax=Nitrogeniibacter mangrovi TaxID=2016596 RepID=A0A6C1B2B1_9RHOO|nr:thiamine pyrophosphate-binding protein [Nitrogeniibacter mangrovi]QID16480.1 thiamine pyrophosphate-binding protein [Nitrogeniibacter mangrovi]
MDRPTPTALMRSDDESRQTDVADLIIAHLEQIGVEYVFGVPGGAIEPLYNALARSARRHGPRIVTTRHEAGAAFMAEGYARESGRLGVCIATSGPGATNLITGVACAHDNNIPVLAITGQPKLTAFGRRALQESGCTGVNTLGMFRHCTGYNTLLSHPEQAEPKVVSAIAHAMQHRAAAHLTIPVDIQRAPAPSHWHAPAQGLKRMLQAPALVDAAAVEALFDALTDAKRPVFLLGQGCGGAVDLFLRLIEAHGARFVTTPDAKGFVNPAHPLYRGVFGFAGHDQARALLMDDPDLIVAVGVSLGEWTSAGWSEALLNDRLIHIDARIEHLQRSSMARLQVQGNPVGVARHLLTLMAAHPPAPRTSTPAPGTRLTPTPTQRAPGVRPQVLMEVLSERCPPTTNFLADPGNSTAWAIHHLELHCRRQRPASTEAALGLHEQRNPAASWLRVLMDFAPMGWAISASIGVALARRGQPVVCLTGDGSYLMSGQELTVAQTERLPVIFVVLNDAALGMVKHGQRLAGAEPIGFQLPRIDFAAQARALGVDGRVINSEAELAALDLNRLLTRNAPTLLDVRIDAEQEPPIRMRLEALGTAR